MPPDTAPNGDQDRITDSAASETPSISVDEYRRLPQELRREVDEWLAVEGLKGEHLTWLRLLEGAIEAERFVTDADGHVIARGGEIVRETRVYRIKTAPPREALA